MAESGKHSANRKCTQCGADLPGNLPDELCPKCLLKAAMGTQPVLGPTGTVALPSPDTKFRGLPQPGEELGHYRIVRVLGRGGMGAAFEAEDLETGRRVALKVLSHTLDAPDARERFFREGRLAASINHPNSVYVFGTEEIGGTPVISMELVAGGTLQDRVSTRGPLPIGEAVDAVLQIIAGLEAAQRIGILHRDIKPSNCFCDLDGTVKVGDFGLSISTTVRTEPALTATGAFLGTPAFCPPEQLRGDELNVRSDMYSVGATLFYLLTGRTPFEGKSSVQLLATVLEQHAPSPTKFRKDIPRGLANVILRCLAKQPTDRLKNYAELTQALTPYSSAAPTPATLGLRFAAGVVDHLLVGFVCFTIIALVSKDIIFAMDAWSRQPSDMLLWMLGGLLLAASYYTVMEAIWGFTVGKALCRLRVVGPDNGTPGWGRAIVRAGMYVLLPPLPYWLAFQGDYRAVLSMPQPLQFLLSATFGLVLLGLFCTARRRNGFAALHDLVTRTRVLARVAVQARPGLESSEAPPPAATEQTVGPYHVLETLHASANEQWLLGYDLRLLRKVWLRLLPSGTPPVDARLRNLGRVGRLRWLTGRRSPEENWDAYEAASGQPLLKLIQVAQPWRKVRFWLYDLANEVSAAEKDGTLPIVLALDRVWITSDGRAKLLDFTAPGMTDHSPAATSPQSFLNDVANASLTGESGAEKLATKSCLHLPLHARGFLQSLAGLPDTQSVARALQPLLQRASEVTKLRRAAILAGCLAVPMVVTVGMLMGIAMLDRWTTRNPGVMELNSLLHLRGGMNSRWARNQPHPTDRQFAIFIAQHYSQVITNQDRWNDLYVMSMIQGENRKFAEQSVAGPAASEKEIAEAEAALGKYVSKVDSMSFFKRPDFVPTMFLASLAIYVGAPALIAALLFRGGLVLLVSGVTFVRRDGALASRLRVFWRGLVAWSPLLAAPFVFGFLKPITGNIIAGAVAACLVGVPAVLSMVLPNRGLPDRLAGTWPILR
ncbi:MAG TPA: protein kinase [Verrucomicrobiae bacterium]|nr:protein kinase [Verrucomicrobiae bacterium]